MKQLGYLLLSLISVSSYAGTFTSQASTSWGLASTWSFTGDADGIPDADDDVTIQAGHNVSNNIANSRCRHLTVNGTLTGGSSMVLYVGGNYTVSGTEAGSGAIAFTGVARTISGAGTFSTGVRYTFASGASTTILAGTTLQKSSTTISIASATVTNLGTVTVSSVPTSTGATWINGTNSSLNVRTAGFMAGRTFTANAVGNTVRLSFATGNVPLTTSGYQNLILQATTTGSKTLTANTVVGGNLTINNLNILNTNNFDLSVGGNWVKNGTFTASVGRTVTFNGSSPQTISGTGTTTFEGLTINNPAGVSISTGTYVLNEVLTISAGTFNTFGNSFTMTSTASKTARIAPITGGGSIAGNFTIQRFLSSRTQSPTDDPGHWSDLSSPVQSSTMADWDAELFFSYPHNPPLTSSNVQTWSEPADDWFGVTAATVLTPGKGWEIALTDNATLTSFTATTLTTFGVPNQGSQDLTPLLSNAMSGDNLIGNPFASSISWTSVFASSSGISNQYSVYDANDANYVFFGLGTEIGAGQGFWVAATGTPSVIIHETAKTTSSNSTVRSMAGDEYAVFRLKGADESIRYAHSLKVTANEEASNGLDFSDLRFRKSPVKGVPNLTTTIDGKELSVTAFSLSSDSYSLPLNTRTGIAGNYVIEATDLGNLSEYNCITLEDTKLNKLTEMHENSSYVFEMTAGEPESRFIVHFSKDGNCRQQIAETLAASIENNITILPSSEGNLISFGFAASTPALIEVTNVLGQSITAAENVAAHNQTVNIAIPSDFSGMYLVRVSTAEGAVVKKFFRK
jgi:hypothetical protein